MENPKKWMRTGATPNFGKPLYHGDNHVDTSSKNGIARPPQVDEIVEVGALGCCESRWDCHPWVGRKNASIFRPPLYNPVFSRMRSKGSCFTLGVWGLRVCSLDLAFTIATVCNRPQPSARSPYGRAYGKFCRGGPFWGLQTCRCFVSRGRRGTS